MNTLSNLITETIKCCWQTYNEQLTNDNLTWIIKYVVIVSQQNFTQTFK